MRTHQFLSLATLSLTLILGASTAHAKTGVEKDLPLPPVAVDDGGINTGIGGLIIKNKAGVVISQSVATNLPVGAVTVANNTELTAAIRQLAVTGGHIALQPGTYTAVYVGNVKVPDGKQLVITSLDPKNRANVQTIRVVNSNNIVLSDLSLGLVTLAANYGRIVDISGSTNVTLTKSVVRGPKDDKDPNGARAYLGVNVLDSKGVTVTKNDVARLLRGIVVGRSADITVSNNNVTDLRSDGLNFAQVKNVVVDGNNISFMNPDFSQGDHPDLIQFFTYGTKTPTENVVLSNNTLLQPNGISQGIFMQNEEFKHRGVTGLEYRNIRILNNIVYTASPNAITMGTTIGGEVSGNIVLTPPSTVLDKSVQRGYIASIAMDDTQNVVIRDNVSSRLFITDRARKAVASGHQGTVATGNYIVKRVEDTSAAYQVGVISPVVNHSDLFTKALPPTDEVKRSSFALKARTVWPTQSTTR